MKISLLLASLVLWGAVACGIVALVTNRWTVSTSSSDDSYVGLWQYCLKNFQPVAGIIVPSFCRDGAERGRRSREGPSASTRVCTCPARPRSKPRGHGAAAASAGR